jgi:hypothetical protein
MQSMIVETDMAGNCGFVLWWKRDWAKIGLSFYLHKIGEQLFDES